MNSFTKLLICNNKRLDYSKKKLKLILTLNIGQISIKEYLIVTVNVIVSLMDPKYFLNFPKTE